MINDPAVVEDCIQDVFVALWEQREKMADIDKYVLLEGIEQNKYPCVVIILGLLSIIIVGGSFYRKELKIMKLYSFTDVFCFQRAFY